MGQHNTAVHSLFSLGSCMSLQPQMFHKSCVQDLIRIGSTCCILGKLGTYVRYPQRDRGCTFLTGHVGLRLKVYWVGGFCSYLLCYGLCYFGELCNSYYWASLHSLFLGRAVTIPHYFMREVTEGLRKVASGRTVNRTQGVSRSGAKSQSLSHTAFQDELRQSVLICQ